MPAGRRPRAPPSPPLPCPLAADAALRQFYDHEYHLEHDAQRPDPHRLWRALRELEPLGGTEFLDLGGGVGWGARLACERGGMRHAVSLDFSRKAIELGRAGTDDIGWVNGDGTALPFADDSFDRALSFGSLEDLSDPFSRDLLARYDERYPGSAEFSAESGCSGMYRGLKPWEAAVNEAGSLEQEAVVKALDRAAIAHGPGGAAEMVPGQHPRPDEHAHRPGDPRQVQGRRAPAWPFDGTCRVVPCLLRMRPIGRRIRLLTVTALPETLYAKSGDVHVAYQATGSGDISSSIGDVLAKASPFLAEHIPGAVLRERPGSDHFAWFDVDVADLVEEFLTGASGVPDVDRALATVLITDIVGSTARAAEVRDRRWRELLDAHDDIVVGHLQRFRGRLVKSTGDGCLATFDGPGRAVRCAIAMRDRLRTLGIETRCGIHAGEVELRGADLGGIGVHIAARVSSLAGPGDVLVSRTVVDLVVGSGIAFHERGEHVLKGVPGSWRLFTVEG